MQPPQHHPMGTAGQGIGVCSRQPLSRAWVSRGENKLLTLLSLEDGDTGALTAASPPGASLLTSSITCHEREELHPGLLLPHLSGV